MTVPCEVNHSKDVPADLKMDSLQNGQPTLSTTEEENYALEKVTTVAVDDVKQKDKAICTLNDSHSSDPVPDADRSRSTTDHSNKNKEQTMKQAVHIDIPDHSDDIAYREICNGKKHVVSSVDVTACDKPTSKDTVKNESKPDVFSSEVRETVPKESNAIANFEVTIPENTGVAAHEPANENKRKTRKKKKKKEKKKSVAIDEQTSEATLENDGHGININENVDKEKSVISDTPQEEKMKMVKYVAERPVLTVSECKSDILEMIQNSSYSILESISGATGYGLAENADSRKEKAETAGERRGGNDMELKPDHFDNLPWEVEFTADAWKHLRSKSVQMRLKQRAVKIITELANGNWRPEFYKPASTSTRNIFTSELSKTTSLIWEKAVAFSGRCSDSPSKRMQNEDDGNFAVKGGRIYTQIIRVWDIVSSDDDSQRLLDSIRKSYKRGKMSLLKRNLQGLERSNHTDKQKHLPLLFAEQDMRVQETITCMFFHPASPDPREYHILKFYAFTSALVNIVLSNMTKKADLPFKVTDKEHAIIHLSGEAPILLQGRSGTGKTTSCLYRLWTNFISYWRIAQERGAPLIPRMGWAFAAPAEDDEDGNPEDDEQADSYEAADVQPSFERQEEEEDQDYGEYDHLHQIFVTKNPVLCTEVHKNFYELCHACDETADHVEAECQEIPPRLQDVEDLSYPLFLTSKQLLMMLDGSLGQPYFFERGEDGSLGATVRGWEEQGDALGISLMDQDSDEDFMGMNNDYDEDVQQQEAAAGLRQRKLNPRKEVTYEVFASTIWPKIKKKAKYHPSLVWTEIMSFIKGSFEALATSEGHLSEKDYIEVGRKKAPNFSGLRKTVYQLFERYDFSKKQNLLFDKADLVSDIFKRLKKMNKLPWIVHQLYVDETQDFTQAELSVLIRITQHPNDMFLTGDTTQGIMRGISCRFSDLKSLFFQAKKSLAAGNQTMLNEPKQVYQLTHSYRSHGGILALASAVLDLMVEFFPESFDKLKKDQGLLDGPLPLLMESCSPQDLAILLQGNNRKASHIEFGAHQAILVVNDEAKEKMPDMLSRHSIVLTIYESKGLEFDDILLYNFFTDSQATKEWRVVTTFLEKLAACRNYEEQAENLHVIDAGMLTQPNRPRALVFEANEHKILNSELKYLYTALTRARVNVWIFDEDEEKRAPMFEYFKARQLVRCISQTEDGNSEFTHMVFAMKSAPEDWVKRGDEMMSQALYEVAACCYRMGGDDNKEQLALAHCQAQGALKLKDTPRKMREEFVCAAHKFLHCGDVIKAATCLQNAREFELAAKLFQKMKKFQEAARLFQRSGKHADTSECYEELGLYNRAVELLDKEALHELAIDCLKRYQTKVQEMRGTDREMLKMLESNKPGAQFTLENLYFKLVKFNHKHRNKPKMLSALDHLPYDDQLEFLEKHQYLQEAVQLMLRGGQSSHSDVAQMLLRHGATRDALHHAEKGPDVDVRGKCHHTLALELYFEMEEKSQHEELHIDSSKKEIVSHFQKATTAFEETENNNSAGMASLVIAMVQNRKRDAQRAFGFFKKVSPFANEAGMVEAMKIIVRSVSNGKLSDCQWLVTAIETLLTVISTLLKADSREKHSRCTLYLKLYGLHQDDKDPSQLIAYRRQKNLCADVLSETFRWKDKRTVHFDKQDISFKLSIYLVGVLKEWIKICRNWLDSHVSRNIQCRSFQEGRCVGSSSCDNNKCHHLHEPFTRETALKGLKALLLKVKLEDVLHRGVKSLWDVVMNVQSQKKNLNDELTALTDDTATSTAFEKLMKHFIIPEGHHLRNLTENEVVMRKFRDTLDSVNLKSFIQEMVNCWCCSPLQVQCKSSDWFVRATVLVSLFKIQHIDLKKIGFNIKRQLQGSDPLDEEARNAFISFERDNLIIHLGGQFYEAFGALKDDPISSVFAYSKFVKILGDRNIPMVFPKMPLFLFCHEVFITIALTSFAKLSSETGRFVLPATYLATLPYVSAMLPQGSSSIQWSINSISRGKESIKTFQVHIQRLAGVLCGSEMRMNLLSCLFRPRRDFDYLQAERCLILALVVLANVGLLLDPPVEVPLMEALMRLELPEDAPTRLKNGLQSIKKSHGIADLVDVLQRMLKEREDENLLLCEWKWNPQRKEGIQHQQLKSLGMFPSAFVNFVHTLPHAQHEKENNAARVLQRFIRNLTLRRHIELGNLKQRCEQQILKGISISAEETQREKDEFDKYVREEQEDRSARVLQRFFRRLSFTGRIEGGNIRERCQQQKLKEIFSFYDITEDQCGVCRVSFKAEETDKPSFESDMDQTGTTVEMTQIERGTQHIVFENFMNQQKTSQKLREEHLSSPIHMMNMMNFNVFKKLYKEYFVSKMSQIQTFVEKMRKGEICMNMAAVHLARLEFIMHHVQVLYQGIFNEFKWDLVYELSHKVNRLCMYYKGVSEDAEMMKKQSLIQVDEQPQPASGDSSSIPDITRQHVGAEHVPDDGNRGAGYGRGGVSQQYGRDSGHGKHGRYHDGHNENNRGQQGHRGGRGVYDRGGRGNRGPHEYYGRGNHQHRAGGFGRGYGGGRGRGSAGQGRGRGQYEFPYVPPRHQRLQQLQQFQEQRYPTIRY
ncbi:TPR and ankyrin repeat-containing protein 1-like isoform X2 [Haliotis rubra]|uniref:TPR and ankyrin repeat-containing protein 1-like isoform X2 n=1 Tax=Haliotis rubra TaxID=36100 RepID=UPI001EE51838|nr:TPR and ankyrin repeat-containing protein 1-like isoform X2 [Haliotis rubra]